MTLHEYSVGKPFPASVPKNASETHYVFSAGGHMLVVLIPQPTRAEIEAVRKAPVDLGLYVQEDLLLILYRSTISLLPQEPTARHLQKGRDHWH